MCNIYFHHKTGENWDATITRPYIFIANSTFKITKAYTFHTTVSPFSPYNLLSPATDLTTEQAAAVWQMQRFGREESEKSGCFQTTGNVDSCTNLTLFCIRTLEFHVVASRNRCNELSMDRFYSCTSLMW